MSVNISDSLNQLKDVLNNSNGIITKFRDDNKSFHQQLLEKIKSIIDMIQSITNNPNIKNMHDLQGQLKQTQDQLAQAQAELNNGNQGLKESQETIMKLQQEQTDLQNQLKSSQDDNGNLKAQLEDIQKQLSNEQSSQANIINNIAQVNSVLTNLVSSINDTVQNASTYNSDYQNQIEMISSKLQEVVNLLNGSGSGSDQGSQPEAPTRPSYADVTRRGRPSIGGKRKKGKKSRKGRKSKRNKKGGWTHLPTEQVFSPNLSSSIAASSTTRKRRRHKKH